jgi:predicted ATP-binding protein involved in virulence
VKNIEKIVIEKLHGELSFEIEFNNNRLVIVASNGAGKTTIVNIIYYALSRQWNKLSIYNFQSISFHITDADTITISKSELSEFVKARRYKNSLRRNIPSRYADVYQYMSVQYTANELSNNYGIVEELSRKFNMPISHVIDLMEEISIRDRGDLFTNSIKEKESLLKAAVDAQILYLPTYRRIEQDLKTILPHLEENIENYRRKTFERENLSEIYVELVEFGMEDVEENIKKATMELYSNFNNNLLSNITGSYLRDIISRRYMDFNMADFQNLDIYVLDIVLQRINDAILDKSEKEKLRTLFFELTKKATYENEDRVIAYFITRLMEIYKQQREKEKDIEDFVDVCNSYITNKTFSYNPIEYSLNIILNRNDKPIMLKELSSGEKQIVSLFSHLYLSKEKKFFLIIDEPELSLSVPWQQKLLPDIIKAKYCSGLLAVTHSPFIFDNTLEANTKSLETFFNPNV